MTGVVIALTVVAVLVAWHFATAARRSPAAVGHAAPEFELPDQQGRLRSLGEFRGKWLVLYFFPRADTPGWTEQAARYRDAMQEIGALGAVVCGVSVDGSERLGQFAAKYRLPFTLLSDRGGAVAASYGSLINLGLLKFARRNTFLVDPQGCVARVYLGVQPAQNAADVIADLRELNRA